MRVVLDTNVMVSALIKPGGIPAQILAHATYFALITSDAILTELERVLPYERIKQRYKLSDPIIEEYLAGIRDDRNVVAVIKAVTGVSQDPDDDKFLACAETPEADCIVSGDPQLTNLGSY